MKKSILALFFLLTLASQGTWCASERSTTIDAARLKPRLQVLELHEIEGKKLLEIQNPRKLGREQSLTHHEVNTVEKHPRRMAIGHKGGSMGGGSGGGTSVGGSGATSETRPHTTKNGGAPALPVPITSILTLAFTSAIVLSTFSF